MLTLVLQLEKGRISKSGSPCLVDALLTRRVLGVGRGDQPPPVHGDDVS
jgi:hypothetical protein